jgi:hypothetical protein
MGGWPGTPSNIFCRAEFWWPARARRVTPEEFFSTVRQSAVNCRRRFVELQTTGHAPDHPRRSGSGIFEAIYLGLP